MSDKKIKDNIVTIDEQLIKRVIGYNVKKIREQKKMTRTNLANMIKMPVSGVRKIELGLSYISVFNLVKIAIALGITCDTLLTNGSERCYLDSIVDKLINEIIDEGTYTRCF